MKPGVDFIGTGTPFFCNDGNGKFLLNKRSVNCRDEHGAWDPGSGRLELGSTFEENALREVLEEYGCKGEIQEQLPAFSLIREWEGKQTHWVMIPFFIKVDPKEAKNNEPEKIDEIGWFSLDNLPSPLHTGFQYELEYFRTYFKKYD